MSCRLRRQKKIKPAATEFLIDFFFLCFHGIENSGEKAEMCGPEQVQLQPDVMGEQMTFFQVLL